jgi:hypothetical protein
MGENSIVTSAPRHVLWQTDLELQAWMEPRPLALFWSHQKPSQTRINWTSKPSTIRMLFRILTQGMFGTLTVTDVPRLTNLTALHREIIFNIPKTIAFLSQGTTLERGTIIMTGTGPGIGMVRKPKVVLRHGDDMRVYIQGIGTLINEVYHEQ